ncbi:MAG: cell division protein [Bacteroidetes bacterium]|nr:cell division protein [Bacteroidota bacterium]
MKDIRKDILWRVYLLYFVVLVFGLTIVGRVVYIQLTEGDALQMVSQEKEYKFFSLEANRGNISDCNNNLLATSVPVFEIRMDVDSENISDKLFNDKADSLALCLSKLFKNKSKSHYLSKLKKARKDGNRYLLIERNASYEDLKELRSFPIFRLGKYRGGLITIPKTVRKMPFGDLAKRTIGYENKTENLFVGLEGAYSEFIQGRDGNQLKRRINHGDWIPVNDENDILPVDGKDIFTTIDVNLQDVAQNALKDHLFDQGAYQGCAILMEVSTGHIKAITSLRYDSASQNYHEAYNYAIAENVEPGSTFKLMSMMAALELTNINLLDSVDTENGVTQYHDRFMKDDHKIREGGKITIREAFELSSNVVISKIIYEEFKEKPEKLVEFLYDIPLNKPLGIEIKGEGNPYIKHPDNKRYWYGTTIPWMSIGYELTLTPLQTLAYYNAVANGGRMMKPMFVKEIRHGGKVIERFKPETINRKICSRRTVDTLQSLLEGVVLRGTATSLNKTPYLIAGKTGTAQIAEGSKGYNKENYNASFAGYFPADNPKYSCIVVVNNPTKGRIYGSSVAAPVFKEIADKVYATQLDLHSNNSVQLASKFSGTVRGNREDLEKVFDALKVPNDLNSTAEWVSASQSQDTINLRAITTHKTLVPNVKGMSVKDAIYLLEQYGLKVKIIGKGKVSSQSLRPGTVINGSKEIILNLAS